MIALLHFATLVVTTMFAGAAAVGLNWMLLRGAFWMMRPATAGRVPAEDGIGAGDGAVGAGVFDDAVRGRWYGHSIGWRMDGRSGKASGLKA
jgi:hypothetical protein